MEETQLRRGQNTLFILGGGVITFGVWSVVKSIMYFLVDPSSYFYMKDLPQEFRLLALVIMYGIVALIVGLDVGLRLYVGLSARAEARGKKKSRAYIRVAAVMAAANLLLFLGALVSAILNADNAFRNLLDTLVSAVVDVTALITLIELVFTARRVQQLRKQLSM